MNDLRFALRQLLKSPGFSVVAILSLALGISANVVVIGWVQAMLLKAVPGTQEPGRLVAVVLKADWGVGETMSYPNLRDLGEERSIFVGTTGSDLGAMHVRHGERSEWAWAELTTANYFQLLGVRAVLGRLDFPPDSDAKPGSAPEIVLSERFWKRFFHSDPKVVGKVMQVNRHSFSIIGVAEESFNGITGGLAFDFWAPMAMHRELGVGAPADKRSWNSFHTLARLQPGVTLEQANVAARAVAARLREQYPQEIGKRTSFGVVPLWKSPWGGQAVFLPLLVSLGAATAMVFLLVVANLSNLLLARATSRQREMAVRLALGASRWRLIRQLLMENLLLASLGGALAIVLSSWGIQLLHAFTPSTHLPLSVRSAFDWQLAAVGIGLSMASALLFGLIPAWHSSQTSSVLALNEGARGTDAAGRGLWIRRGLVVAQIALAFVLLVSATLCVQSFVAARRIPIGFDPKNVWLAGFHLGSHGYEGKRLSQFTRDLRSELLGRPGVIAVGFTEGVPLGFEGGAGGDLEIPGMPPQPGENRQAHFRRVTPGYFEAMRIPIHFGREFRDDDDEKAPSRIIVNQTVVDKLLKGREPLGSKIRVWGRECEIVGVASAGKYRKLGEPPAFAVWTPAAQWGEDDLTAVIRTEGDPHAVSKLVTSAVKQVAPEVDIFASDTLENYISPAFLLPRTAAALLTSLGVIALSLSVMGIYGVMSFQVNRRRREIGIRLSLGAEPSDVIRMILGQGARLVMAGVVLGLVGALGATRLLQSILVGVGAWDLLTYGGTLLVLGGAAWFACWIPAQRAARVDPAIVLRIE